MNFSVFLVILLVNFCAIILPASQSAGKNTDSAQENFISLITDIQYSNNEGYTLKQIEHISDYRYAEVGNIILDLLEFEISNRKNKRVIEELLSLLSKFGDRHLIVPPKGVEEVPYIDFRESFLNHIRSEDRFRSSANYFNQLLRDVGDTLKNNKTRNWKKLFPSEENKVDLVYVQERVKAKEASKEVAKQMNEEATTSEIDALAKYKYFKQALIREAGPNWAKKDSKPKEVKAGDSSPAEILLAGTTRFITDDIVDKLKKDDVFRILFRDKEMQDLIFVLSQYKQQNAMLLGSKGAGKTSIMEALARAIVLGLLSENKVTEFLSDAVIVETSSARISRLAKSDKPSGQADALEAYFESLKEMTDKTDRRIIVFIDEIHTMSPEQIEAMKPFIESSDSKILLVGASTSPEFRNAFKINEAFLRRIQDIAVREFTEAEILQIFKESWMSTLSRRHPELRISDAVKKALIKKSRLVYPDKGSLDGSFVLADHLAGRVHFANNGKPVKITERVLNQYIQEKTGLPVDTKNFRKMEAYRQELLGKVKSRVLGQDLMIEDLVDLWMGVLRNEGQRGVRVGMLMGRSGTGKTESAKVLATHALGSEERVFVIKANQFKDADDFKMSTLTGVPGGVSFGKQTSGRLMDWLDDPTKGKYGGIILIDEAEKANDLFWETLMEMFEEGKIVGGDGKERHLNRHLIVMTSNLGDKKIFPDESITWSEERVQRQLEDWDEERLRELFEEHIPDSIVNRIDKVSLASIVMRSTAIHILQLLQNEFAAYYKKEAKVKLEFSDKLAEHYVDKYDPTKRGARVLVRSFDSQVRKNIEIALGTIRFKRNENILVDIKVEDGRDYLVLKARGKEYPFALPRTSNLMCKEAI